MASWDEKYAALNVRRALQSGVDTASQIEIEENGRRRKFERLLEFTLGVDDRVNWDSLKDKRTFKRDKFRDPRPQLSLPAKPEFSPPQIGFLQKLFGQARSIMDRSEAEYHGRIGEWEKLCAEQTINHQNQLKNWNNKQSLFDADQDKLESEFNNEKERRNAKIDELLMEFRKEIYHLY